MKLKQADIGKIRKAMEKALDTKRYEHTLGVAYTASCLAMCYDEIVRIAELAGYCMIVPSVFRMRRRSKSARNIIF